MKPRSTAWREQSTGPRRPTPLLERFGRDLAGARAAWGLSQRQLGRMAEVDQASISRLERGLAGGMAVERLARLINVIGWPTVDRPRTDSGRRADDRQPG
jgi:ribosome-binding protein aMBF1 (putative translation factor)